MNAPGPHRGNEDALVHRLRTGDPAAIEQVLREHVSGVHAVCRRLCRNPADADDAAQEALIAIVRGLPRFDGRSALSSWIYRVTTNACLDELRRLRRRPDPVEPGVVDRAVGGPVGVTPEDAAIGSETRQELATALDSLPEEFRVAVVLRDVADLDYVGIAEITDVPVGTVRSRIARGRARLADALAIGSPGLGGRTGGTEVHRRSSEEST